MLFAVVVAALLAPGAAEARSRDVRQEQTASGAFASVDLVAPRPPEPPSADIHIKLTENGEVVLDEPSDVQAASAMTGPARMATATVRVEAGNVRIAPDISSAIIGSVHLGDELELLGVSDEWYLARLHAAPSQGSAITGEVGWVHRMLLDAPDDVPTLAASSASAYRWLAATDSRVIYDTDGVLHLQVTDEQARAAVSSDLVVRTGEQAPAKTISFTLTLHWSKGHAPGGSVFRTTLGDGRDVEMRVGPGEGFPWVEWGVDGQTLHGSGAGFPLYTPTPVQWTWTGSEVVATVGGEERARIATTTPMTDLRIAVETEPGCVFHLTVDDMTVVAAP